MEILDMGKVYTKADIVNKADLSGWLKKNHKALIGSAVFTKTDSFVSNLVSWAQSFKCPSKGFCPSHIGSIIELGGKLYVFHMKPLKSYVVDLYDYLLNTEEDYRLVKRDFEIDTYMFSKSVGYHVGEWYPYLSAIASVFSKRQSKFKTHCSELHLRNLQLQDLFLDINPECTPDELYHLLT
jgi:hypothetical protein